jgi:hypothetical protein
MRLITMTLGFDLQSNPFRRILRDSATTLADLLVDRSFHLRLQLGPFT